MAEKVQQPRQARPRWQLTNMFTGWILRGPLHRLADREVIELRYTANSGRPVKLPVMYAERGDELVVLIGGSKGKSWWRHFRRPQPVRVLLRGVSRSGVAHVVDPADDDRPRVRGIYEARYPDIPARDDPLISISLDPALR